VAWVDPNVDLPSLVAARMPSQERTYRPILRADRQGVTLETGGQNTGEHVEHAIEVKGDDRLIHAVNHGRRMPRCKPNFAVRDINGLREKWGAPMSWRTIETICESRNVAYASTLDAGKAADWATSRHLTSQLSLG
jgi:hypothetical protein